MTVASNASRMPAYVGNGTASQFPVTIPFRKSTDLKLVILTPTKAEIILAFGSQYAINSATKVATLLPFASWTWVDSTGKLLSGYSLYISRDSDPVQATSFKDLGSFEPPTHERAFDYLTMLLQEALDYGKRSLRLRGTVSPTDFNPHLPADIVGKVGRTIVTNSTGNGLEFGPSIADLNTVNANAAAAGQAAIDAGNAKTDAVAAKNAAQTSSANAATSEGNASNSAIASNNSAVAAAASATAAGTSASSAATSAAVAAAGSLKVVGTVAAPVAVANSGYTFDTSVPELEQVVYVKSNGGSVDVTAAKQITDGNKIGQVLELHGTSDTDELHFSHGRGLVMNGEYFLARASVISFRWNGTVWCERFRNGVTK